MASLWWQHFLVVFKKRFLHIILGTTMFLFGGIAQDVHCATPVLVDPEASWQEYVGICNFPILEGWVYQSGDDPLWASPDFDDTSWSLVTRSGADRWYLPEDLDWTGVGWFRLHVVLPDSLSEGEWAFLLYHSGAMEVFVDGNRIHHVGNFEPVQKLAKGDIVLPDLPKVIPWDPVGNKTAVIAVRYRVSEIGHRKSLGIPTGWGMALALYQDASQERDEAIRERSAMQMLAAVPLVFAVLHLLFFVFYKKERSNLYYAIFCGWTALLIFLPMFFPFMTEHLGILFVVFKVALICTVLSSLKFYYYEFFNRMPSYWAYISWPLFVLACTSWLLPLNWVYGLAFLGFPELIRIVSKAIYNNRPGAWIIAVGLSVFTLGCGHQILIELNVFPRTASYYYIYGILCLVVSMSVYLAYTFGAVNRQLEQQVLEIQRLSEQNIKQSQMAREQERENRERETARKLLEAENEMRTVELASAQQQQKMLEDLEQSHEALHHTQAQLVQAEKMASLGNLVAGIAHEINTPVGAINSMHDTLVRAVNRLETDIKQKFPDDHPEKRAITAAFQVIGEANRVIATGTERVRDIVRSLRNFARLDEAEWKRVDVHEGIESTLALVHHALKNRIEVVKEYGALPLVECFPGRLNQVFLNLLVNGAQAIEGEGKITIRTWQTENCVRIAIEDTGKGIEPENLRRIFDSGFTTKKVGMGTGLGLSICSQIIEAHHGEILVSSKVGVGSVFTVVLPIRQQHKEESES